MKAKVLLGTIGTVTILILVSFTNVGGIQSTPSGTANDSPLFSIRTQNKINQASETKLIAEYLGKGVSLIQVPDCSTKTLQDQLLPNCIAQLQEAEVIVFANLIFNKLNNQGLNTITIPQIKQGLDLLKNNPDLYKTSRYRNTEDNTHVTRTCVPSIIDICWSTINLWFPGCIIAHILITILKIITFIIFPTAEAIPTCFSCGPHFN